MTKNKKFACIVFIIALIVFGLIFVKKEIEKREFIDEYNEKYEEIISLMEKYEVMTYEIINTNSEEFTDKELYLMIKNYVEEIDKDLPKFYEFQNYIEDNHQKLLNIGENPDYLRDNMKDAINQYLVQYDLGQQVIYEYEAFYKYLDMYN